MNRLPSLLSFVILASSCGKQEDSVESTPISPFRDAAVQHGDGSTSDAGGHANTRDASSGPSDNGGDDEDCSGAAKLVYVLDVNGTLSSFRPDTLAFTDIGQVNCEASEPNSMSVDRQGTAWVAYQSGAMYQVSTSDASCKPIARTAGAGGFNTFGMGFVADDGKPDADLLYIASSGDLSLSLQVDTQLGVIDPNTLSTTPIGKLDGAGPELTGTADGKLWAFYAQDIQRSLARIDPSTGATLESHALGTITGFGANSWAMAFWGGDFFIFLQAAFASSTTVYRVDGQTFAQTVAIQDTGRSIVGAGVSTCAPLIFAF